MLKLTKIKFFAVDCPVCLPTEVPGKFEEGEFTSRFKYVPHQDYLTLLDGARRFGDKDEQASMTEIIEYKRKSLEELLDSVDGITDEEGGALPADQQRAAVLGSLPLINAAFDGFCSGYNAAPGKNSKRSPKR